MQQPPNDPNYPNQQQPYYPPSQAQQPYPYGTPVPPQQPKKRGRGCLIGGVIAAIVVVVIIVAAANSGKGNTSTGNNNSQSGQSTQASSSGSSAHKVGDSITIDGWIVTLNSAKTTTTGTIISTPKAGNDYLLVDVTVANNTGKSQPVSSLIQFALKDASGQGYNETLGSSEAKTPDGTLANGSKLRGTIGYEVPKSAKSFELDFSPALGSTDQAVWNFSV